MSDDATDFRVSLMKKYNENKNNQRYGQFLMNELHAARPDIYHKVTNGGADCFYDDSKIWQFWLIVEQNW